MNIKPLISALGFVSATLFNCDTFAGQIVDAEIPEYQKTSSISGNLSSIGSYTLANLMKTWAEEFKHSYPNVNITIQTQGSSTASPPLTEATVNFGAMSRRMRTKELENFEKKYGYKPTAIPVAIDALSIYANKHNPIKGLTIPQVDAIFSSTRHCGNNTDIKTWGGVGLQGAWADKTIQLFGRNSSSGTHDYLKKKALCQGEYKQYLNEQPNSILVIQSITTSMNAIGYSGMGYKTSGIKPIPLATKQGQAFIAATPKNVISGKYPLARFLYIYVNKQPFKSLDIINQEFLKMILSQTGQKIVIKEGYIPLPYKVIERALESIQ